MMRNCSIRAHNISYNNSSNSFRFGFWVHFNLVNDSVWLMKEVYIEADRTEDWYIRDWTFCILIKYIRYIFCFRLFVCCYLWKRENLIGCGELWSFLFFYYIFFYFWKRLWEERLLCLLRRKIVLWWFGI